VKIEQIMSQKEKRNIMSQKENKGKMGEDKIGFANLAE